MTAGSGLLLPIIDDLTATIPPGGGVTTLLAAADAARDTLADAQHLASFAPPVQVYRSCPCGSVFEIRGFDRQLDDDDRDAIRDWDDDHVYCGEDS